MCLRWMPSLQPLRELVNMHLDTKEKKAEKGERNSFFPSPQTKKVSKGPQTAPATKLHPDPGEAVDGKRRWDSRGGRGGGGCASIGRSGCPSGVIFVCVWWVFPEPRGSQPRWQATGVPSGALFYSGDPRVRKYRSLCICKQSKGTWCQQKQAASGDSRVFVVALTGEACGSDVLDQHGPTF